MWNYISPTCIYNEEIKLYFIKGEFPDLWRIEPESKVFVYRNIKTSNEETMRYIRTLELECTIWAHGRPYKANLQVA